MKRLTIIILLAAAAGMVSCSAVRHCKAPDVDLPERIAGEDSDSLTVADVQWWRFYGDSTLCQIIERTLDNNRDMLAAAARVERLRELYRVSRAERLPSVTGTAYGDYETNDYAGEKSSRDPGFGAKVTLSWELDLWGNLRWAKRKGGAEYLASVEDRRAMRMTLVASTSSRWITSCRSCGVRSLRAARDSIRCSCGSRAVSPPKWSISRRRWSTPRRPR